MFWRYVPHCAHFRCSAGPVHISEADAPATRAKAREGRGAVLSFDAQSGRAVHIDLGGADAHWIFIVLTDNRVLSAVTIRAGSCRMSRLSASALLPLVALLTLVSLQRADAQSGRCPGQNPEPHAYGSWTFRTTSRIEPLAAGRYHFGVISCADQDDARNHLYVRWLIPGPHGWIPPGGMLESTARLREDDKAPQLRGCLFYGNRPDVDSAAFLGRDGDEKQAEFERERGCAAAAAAMADKPGPIERLIQKVRNFFPSDKAKAEATMLQLNGEVDVEPIGSGGYRSVFRYQIRRTAGSEGSPADVTLRPSFRGAAEALLPAFNKAYPDGVRFGPEGSVSFDVEGVRSGELQYATYAFYDRERRLVAGIDVPVFVPVSNPGR